MIRGMLVLTYNCRLGRDAGYDVIEVPSILYDFDRWFDWAVRFTEEDDEQPSDE